VWPYEHISVPDLASTSGDWNILVAPANDIGLEEPGSERDNALLKFRLSIAGQDTSGWTATEQFKYKVSDDLPSSGQWRSDNSAVQYLAVKKNISQAGTVSDGSLITVPYGSVSDWNLILSPADIGVEEPGSEGDNALLKFSVTASAVNSQQWRVAARFKSRFHNEPGYDGTWFGGSAHYLMVHKYFSVMGQAGNGQCVTLPSGTTLNDWAWIGVANDIGFEEPGSEWDNAILKISTQRTLCNTSVRFKFRPWSDNDGIWYGGTINYLLVRKSGTTNPSATISGPTSVFFSSPSCQSFTWNSSAYGADGPFDYKWYINGSLVGTGSAYTGPLCPPYDTYIQSLTMIVTDTKGKQDTATYSTIVHTICGDGICNPSESCRSCAEDCGECEPLPCGLGTGIIDQCLPLPNGRSTESLIPEVKIQVSRP
jgi:hypothetical protein